VDLSLPPPGSPLARSILESTARFNSWDGPVRSAKTVCSTFAWLRHLVEGPPGDMLMCGKTMGTVLRNVVYPYLLPLLGSAAKVKQGAEFPYIDFPGRKVYLSGAHNVESEERIRGLTLAGAYGDEVTTWTPGFLEQLDARCSVPGASLFLTTNPDSPNHWYKVNYIDRAARGELDDTLFRRFHWGIRENPFLDPEYISNLERTHVGLWRKRFIDGIWALAEGAVFESWDPDYNVYRGPVGDLSQSPLWLGVDVGYSHPTAGILLAARPEGLRVPHEFRATGMTDAGASKRMGAWLSGLDIPVGSLRATVYDRAAPSFGEQLYQDGWPLVTPSDSRDVVGRIAMVSSLIASRVLQVHEGCRYTIDEIPSYRWDEKAQARGEDKPVKEGDDQVDALGYVVRESQHTWRGIARANSWPLGLIPSE
jgi:hypothetical protein